MEGILYGVLCFLLIIGFSVALIYDKNKKSYIWVLASLPIVLIYKFFCGENSANVAHFIGGVFGTLLIPCAISLLAYAIKKEKSGFGKVFFISTVAVVVVAIAGWVIQNKEIFM